MTSDIHGVVKTNLRRFLNRDHVVSFAGSEICKHHVIHKRFGERQFDRR